MVIISRLNVGIEQVVTRAGVRLERSGGRLVARCPFHQEKTPSFVLYPKTNSWACFGAGCFHNGKRNGGGIIEFIKQRYTLSYPEALKWLNDEFGGSSGQKLPLMFGKSEKRVEVPARLVPNKMVLYWHSLLDTTVGRDYFYGRQFDDKTIESELWGFNGERYVIPVWADEPGYSDCIGVRLRATKYSNPDSPKYIGIAEHNPPAVWGRWHCRQRRIVFAFVGEFDAALAVQDGIGAFSLVNGIGSYLQFPTNWPEKWFSDNEVLIACFDDKEEHWAGKLAAEWEEYKGLGTSRIFHWPPNLVDKGIKDYSEFREHHTARDFLEQYIIWLFNRGLRLDKSIYEEVVTE